MSASWNANLPTGTSLDMFARGGDAPDTASASWTAWKPIGNSGAGIGICSRYVQYRADLSTSNTSTTPTLLDVALTCATSGGPGTALSGLASASAPGGNDASGLTRNVLTWSGGGGGGGGVKVYRKGYGGYPAYPGGSFWPPAAPLSPAAAEAASWTLTSVTGSGQSDLPPARDYWSYVAFSTDACGNSSAASNVTGGTLDYLLGDVTDGMTACTGDNAVNTSDISLLGAHYGATSGQADYLGCLDVGPTMDYSTTGRPLPDGIVEFEDLVMFALQYGIDARLPVAPMAKARPTPKAEGERAAATKLTLEVPASPAAGEVFAVAVHASGGGEVQALSLDLRYDHSRVEMVGADAGELLYRQAAQALVLSPKPGRVDLALLGRGAALDGEGTLVVVRFRVRVAGDPAITLTSVDARDGANRKLDLMAGGPTAVPTTTSFARPSPNPFGGTTTLGFALARAGHVELVIYAVDGRRVRTLVDDDRQAGEYRSVWDGTSDRGERTQAGVYFAHLSAGAERFTRPLVLLK